MRRLGTGVLTVVGVIATVGCYTSKKAELTHPHVEEYMVAPQETRYDNPPESGYKKPPPKKEFRPGVNAPGMEGGGPGGPGM